MDTQQNPIGESAAFGDMMDKVSLLAPLDRPVLVIGERGSGKELVAQRLHFLSSRWQGPQVDVNCATLGGDLLDSELFGHEAGAFTGATRMRAGRFERSDGGTLFLDEIATAGLNVQEKILRVIEYGLFDRIGGNESQTTDTRIIAATNEDLPRLVQEGRFRADLLDRLAFDVITVPPLRARQGDIPLLAMHFARRMAIELGRDYFDGFTDAALDILQDYHWPGNVRELKNVVERAVAHAEPDAPVHDIVLDPFQSPWRPTEMMAAKARQRPDTHVPAAEKAGPQGPFNLADYLGAEEKRLLLQALDQNRHHQGDTAKWLGLSYNQLRNRLRKYGLIEAD